MADILYSIGSFINNFMNHVIQEHPEHVLFYLINSVLVTMVLVKNKEAFKRGLEGTNGLWEAPEIVTYIWLWMFPHSINAVLFLDLKPPDMFWYFMVLCLLFALAGRDGIMMLFNWRGIPLKQEPQQQQQQIPQN